MKKKKCFKLFASILASVLCFAPNVVAEEYSTEFTKVFPNNEMEMYSIPIDYTDENQFIFGRVFELASAKNKGLAELNATNNVYGISYRNCEKNNGVMTCNMNLSEDCGNEGQKQCSDPTIINETHDVKLLFKSYNTSTKVLVDKLMTKFSDSTMSNVKYFSLTDMSLINYYSNITNNEDEFNLNKAVNFVSELRKMLENTNLEFTFIAGAGGNEPLHNHQFGAICTSYKGIVYGVHDPVGIKENNIIYIPTDTVASSYITAAKKRIKDYLGVDATIVSAGKIANYTFMGDAYDLSNFTSIEKAGTDYYNVTLGNNTYEFLIIADSSKMEEPEYNSIDLLTNIGVSSKSGLIPLDTSISSKIVAGTQAIKDKVGSDNIYVVDLSLNSTVGNKKIEKLDNGNFLVSIPIPSNLEGKTIKVFYINAEGKREEYEIEPGKSKFATFETNHFSEYILADVGIDNPKTSDSIITYIIITSVSLTSLIAAMIYTKKKKFN